MYILGIDTSTQICSVAIFHSEKGFLAETSQKIGINHSHTLLILVDQLMQSCHLEPKDIKTIVVNHGPGSFTGLRIGMAFAKGFAHAIGANIKSANSLDALAFQSSYTQNPILAIIDAKSHRVYTALYEKIGNDMVRKSEYLVGTIDQILPQFSNLECTLIGDACEIYKNKILFYLPHAQCIPQSSSGLRASTLCELTLSYPYEHIETLEPFYLLKTQAELQLEEKEAKNEKN